MRRERFDNKGTTTVIKETATVITTNNNLTETMEANNRIITAPKSSTEMNKADSRATTAATIQTAPNCRMTTREKEIDNNATKTAVTTATTNITYKTLCHQTTTAPKYIIHRSQQAEPTEHTNYIIICYNIVRQLAKYLEISNIAGIDVTVKRHQATYKTTTKDTPTTTNQNATTGTCKTTTVSR
ncbi:hypothetical protein CHS0354_026568 [Potamilus streckersoni]|uniref:Uncharacterized protein n=1 Tax=Potamilus streckersoni TaxID=2493646 RepID=A0AAE0SUR1_9BIVA|nr:hypothetical protein CHS0354_026568 [Potamilus streckersoni]